MKLCNDPVTVSHDPAGAMAVFVWQGKRYRVTAVEDTWRKCGKWWIDGLGFRRNYSRVTAELAVRPNLKHRSRDENKITVDIYQQGSNWVLSSVCD